MAARIVFTAGFSRRYTGGVREFTVEARNLRGVIKTIDQLYRSTRASATISRRKPPSRSTAPSTKPPISSRSARAARCSPSPNSKGDSASSATTINGANSVYFTTPECTKSRLVGEGAASTGRARISYFRAAA